MSDDPTAPAVGDRPATIENAVRHAWEHLWDRFWLLLGVAGLGLLFSVVGQGPQFRTPPGELGPWSGLAWAWTLFVLVPYGYGQAHVFAQAARGEAVAFPDVWEGFRNYGSALAAAILGGLAVGLGLLLLVVPGIWIGLRLAFVPYLVPERGLGPIEALETSWAQTEGHALQLLGLGLLATVVGLLGLLAFGVGLLLALVFVQLALASFYVFAADPPEASPPPGTDPAEAVRR